MIQNLISAFCFFKIELTEGICVCATQRFGADVGPGSVVVPLDVTTQPRLKPTACPYNRKAHELGRIGATELGK